MLFKPGVSMEQVHAAQAGGQVEFTYSNTVRGFAGRFPPEALEGLRHNPNVELIESDQVVKINLTTQLNPPSWGLDRVDRHYLPLNNSYTYVTTGVGVTAYVIDTGIRISHSDFGGRASWGWDFVDNNNVAYDCDGHGTHVAGTIGGTGYGVAKGVNLVAVRVLDCDGSGYMSAVIAGVDWVAAQHTNDMAVANMSLGGGPSAALDAAIQALVADGVVVVVAAGNENQDACKSSPARAPAAITVGATTRTDYRAYYSNKGSCLDLFAPGSAITSAGIANDTASITFSGTSMASPHVAGGAALYLETNRLATPQQVATALVAAGTAVVKKRGAGSPNKLLYSLFPWIE